MLDLLACCVESASWGLMPTEFFPSYLMEVSCTDLLLLPLLTSWPAIKTSKVRMCIKLVGSDLIHVPHRFSMTCQARYLANTMDLTCVCCNVRGENFANYGHTSSKTLNLCPLQRVH